MKAEDLMSEELVSKIESETAKYKNTGKLGKVLLTIAVYGYTLFAWLSGFTVLDTLLVMCTMIFVWWLWADLLPLVERKFGGMDIYQVQASVRELTFVRLLIKYLDSHPNIKDTRATLDALSERVSRLERTLAK